MYVRYNKDGCIEEAGDWEFPNSTKIDKNVVVGYDGKLYIEGTEPIKSEQEIKNEEAELERSKRNKLLQDTDYLVLPDYPILDEKRQKILAYRQALRDLPDQEGWPMNIVWPEKPSI